MKPTFLLVVVIALGPILFTSGGCQQAEWKEREFQVQMSTGLGQAKTLLKQYANGQPLGSETTDFPNIVEETRKTDPQRAEILQKGFERLQKNPGKAAATAREILKKL